MFNKFICSLFGHNWEISELFYRKKNQILLKEVLFLTEKEERKGHYFLIHIESKQRNAGIVKDVVKSLNIRTMKNLKEAKELLEKYKSITLKDLEKNYNLFPYLEGCDIMYRITEFGSSKCILCTSAHYHCDNCIYSFRKKEEHTIPCMDIIYKEISHATSAEELYNAIQKRISYLTHVIEWYDTRK